MNSYKKVSMQTPVYSNTSLIIAQSSGIINFTLFSCYLKNKERKYKISINNTLIISLATVSKIG